MTSAQSHYLIEWKLEKVVSINPGVRRSKMDFCICQLLANLNGTAVNKKNGSIPQSVRPSDPRSCHATIITSRRMTSHSFAAQTSFWREPRNTSARI